jgi:hypothetical protein
VPNLKRQSRGRRGLILIGLTVFGIATAVALSFAAVSGTASSALPNAGKDNALLASVVERVKTDLSSVTVGPPPASVSAAANSAWLDATHPAGQTPADLDQEAWYAYLIAGAYGAQCSTQGADCLDGYVFQGSKGPESGDSSGRIYMQTLTPSSATPEELSGTITKRLAADGISNPSISFVKPYGLAAIVEVKSNDPQTTIDDLNTGAVFSGLGLDGYLMRIVDSNGETVSLEAVANRAQSGQGYLKPGLTAPNIP